MMAQLGSCRHDLQAGNHPSLETFMNIATKPSAQAGAPKASVELSEPRADRRRGTPCRRCFLAVPNNPPGTGHSRSNAYRRTAAVASCRLAAHSRLISRQSENLPRTWPDTSPCSGLSGQPSFEFRRRPVTQACPDHDCQLIDTASMIVAATAKHRRTIFPGCLSG